MNGIVALLGSGEYLPVMNETDTYLLRHTVLDGHKPRVVCIPTAAGMEGDVSVDRWLRMGQDHFTGLGADVHPVRIVNRSDAEDTNKAKLIESADLIYFSGGNPLYLYETLHDTLAWQAVLTATSRGAALAGCSAGAMFLGEYLPDLRAFSLRHQKAFGLLPKSHIFPHFDRMFAWRGVTMPVLQGLLPDGDYALGLDEDTAMVGKFGDEWQVMGRQRVHVITKHAVKSFSVGEFVGLPV
jgi:cyanophycinase